MLKYFCLFICFLTSLNTQAVLIDKIAGAINDDVFTLSELKRMQDTLVARRQIAPYIYKKESYTIKELLELSQHSFIIRDKLSSIGVKITDDSIESRISEMEKSRGLKRSDLLEFLKKEGISFNEYFDLMKENMELNVFNSRIIAPLVSITDQELKKLFFEKSNNKSTLAFKFKIIDFSISSRSIEQYPNIVADLKNYQQSGVLPNELKNLNTNDLGILSGEDLPKELRQILRKTEESDFSKPYLQDGILHVFFVKKKDLVESEEFIKSKNQLSNYLFEQKSALILESWFNKEVSNYYLQSNI